MSIGGALGVGFKRTYDDFDSDGASIFGIIDPIREEILKTRALISKFKLGSSSVRIIETYSFNSIKCVFSPCFQVLPGKERELAKCEREFEKWKEVHKEAMGQLNEVSSFFEEYDLVKRHYQHGDLSLNLGELGRRTEVLFDREEEVSDLRDALLMSEQQFFVSMHKYAGLLDGSLEEVQLTISNFLASFPSKLGENFPEDRYKGLDLFYLNLLKRHLENKGLEWFNNAMLEFQFEMGDPLRVREMLTSEDRNSNKYRGFNKLYPDCLTEGERSFHLRAPFEPSEEQNQRIRTLSTLEGVREWLNKMEGAGFDQKTGWGKTEGSSELKKSAAILYCHVFTPEFGAEPDVKMAVALAGKVISYYFTNELPPDYHC